MEHGCVLKELITIVIEKSCELGYQFKVPSPEFLNSMVSGMRLSLLHTYLYGERRCFWSLLGFSSMQEIRYFSDFARYIWFWSQGPALSVTFYDEPVDRLILCGITVKSAKSIRAKTPGDCVTIGCEADDHRVLKIS